MYGKYPFLFKTLKKTFLLQWSDSDEEEMTNLADQFPVWESEDDDDDNGGNDSDDDDDDDDDDRPDINISEVLEYIRTPGTSQSHDLIETMDCKRLRTFVDKTFTVIKGNGSVTCAQQTKYQANLFQIMQSESYKKSLMKLFNVVCLSPCHLRVGRRVFNYVSAKVEKDLLVTTTTVQKKTATEQCDDLERHGPGAAKLRYIAGYVVAKTVFRSKQVVSNHMNDINNINVRKHLARISILDHMSNTGQASNFPETLAEINDRQYGHLECLTDEAYLWFHKIETLRVSKLTTEDLANAGPQLPGTVATEIIDDQQVHTDFINIATKADLSITRKEPRLDLADNSAKANKRQIRALLNGICIQTEVLCTLKNDLVSLFMRTGAKAFRQQVHKELLIQKQEAHRIKITQRKRKSKGSNSKPEKKTKGETCLFCTHKLDAKIDWILCDGCQKWVCRKCGQISTDKQWQAAQDGVFLCTNCKPFCCICEESVESTNSLSCLICHGWYCKQCSKVPAPQWKLRHDLALHWCCHKCQ